MIDISKKVNCNGCRLCADICFVGAISFKRDALTGFDYPVINKKICINCNVCNKKCPQINPVRKDNKKEPKVLAAWSIDDEKRMLCTSGGIFYELAHVVIENSGVVVACRYTNDYRGAFHSIAETEEELIALCGSKHVQSNTLHIYPKVKEIINDGRFVFFVGTPCQVSALYRYLDSDPKNLLTADFICNSINSPKAQERYIDYLEKKYNGKIIFSRAKDKRYGWNNFGSSAKFDNGKEYYADRNSDMRVVGYHNGHLFVRESCSDCKYKILPRNADLTLGDFWGIEPDERNPKLEMGTSVILINSQKGQNIIDNVSTIEKYEKDFDDVLSGNRSLYDSIVLSKDRFKAFAALNRDSFDKVVNKYRNDRVKVTCLQRVRRKLGKWLRKVVAK